MVAGLSFVECGTKRREGFRIKRSAIDWRDGGGVATEIDDFAEADLQRAELAAFGCGIDSQGCSALRDDWRQAVGIVAGDNYDGSGEGLERSDVSGEQGRTVALSGCRLSCGPRQQRFVATHSRGCAGSEDDAAKIGHGSVSGLS